MRWGLCLLVGGLQLGDAAVALSEHQEHREQPTGSSAGGSGLRTSLWCEFECSEQAGA